MRPLFSSDIRKRESQQRMFLMMMSKIQNYGVIELEFKFTLKFYFQRKIFSIRINWLRKRKVNLCESRN